MIYNGHDAHHAIHEQIIHAITCATEDDSICPSLDCKQKDFEEVMLVYCL